MNQLSLIEQLRNLIHSLQKENFELKQILKEHNIKFDVFSNESNLDNNDKYDLDQSGRIINKFITDEDAKKFFFLFWGRTDVYAKRGKNGGYFTQCDNRWNNVCPIYSGKTKKCENDCPNRKYSVLTLDIIKKHLYSNKEDGSDVIGVYPLFKDDTCRFIVFDFDNHNIDDNDDWINEVKTVRKVCEDNNISCLVERSRSGNGGHIWILFSEPIKASTARYFGLLLMNRGLSSVDVKSFSYFDRIYPSQNEKKSLGSVIALPLQGYALTNGNSAFVDENFNAYPNQLDYLFKNAKRYSKQQIDVFIKMWQSELALQDSDYVNDNERVKPWRKKNVFDKNDVIDYMNIVLSDGIYIDSYNLLADIKNKIRSLAAFDNPKYYKNRNLGLSNYKNPSFIYMGKDINGYIHLPRGVYDLLIKKCNDSDIEYRITDERILGRKIDVSFKGELKPEQEEAVKEVLNYNDGVLDAATSFGKTVVSSYLIAAKKVSTLILIQNTDLLKQWIDELERFLTINESLPTYISKSGRTLKRKELIGQLHGSKSTLTGIVDIAMIGSLTNKENIDELLNNYGMVIFDECHHAASASAVNILKRVKAKYVFGVSATPYRSDNLEKINYMLLGPVRYVYSSKQRIDSQNIDHYIYPRYTRMVDSFSSKTDINSAYSLIANNKLRNEMIIDDALNCVRNNRIPLLLTRQKDQAKLLYDSLKEMFNNTFIIYGDNTDRQNEEIIKSLRSFTEDDSYIVVATGQKIGEGFDLPRLDTLLLVSPVSYKGKVEQYLGRINRDYPSKKDVIVYDYIDSHMRYFRNMYYKRLKAYKRIGYKVIDTINDRQNAKSIYDSTNYLDVLNEDILNANKSITISSPYLVEEKVDNFISFVKSKQEQGVEVRVICSSWNINDSNTTMKLVYTLNSLGIETITKDNMQSCFAVIDDELVWYGSMNILGKIDYYDNLIRLESKQVAAELLEMELQSDSDNE